MAPEVIPAALSIAPRSRQTTSSSTLGARSGSTTRGGTVTGSSYNNAASSSSYSYHPVLDPASYGSSLPLPAASRANRSFANLARFFGVGANQQDRRESDGSDGGVEYDSRDNTSKSKGKGKGREEDQEDEDEEDEDEDEDADGDGDGMDEEGLMWDAQVSLDLPHLVCLASIFLLCPFEEKWPCHYDGPLVTRITCADPYTPWYLHPPSKPPLSRQIYHIA